ncbi:diacylglycerol/lipid kinase family protein [Streptococcus catagoni]|uniref:diacylglycerol/lipid kinase family protein n=1 Tax=Streptococcus catagoni TaxID=2654874 RepID=UPI00140AB6CD|nr:diacylglycerol kinase family protein [Streptococcus catagoni]
MKKVVLIVNPSAGGEEAKTYQKAAQDKLASYFDQVEVKYTKKAGDAKNFAKKAAQDHYHSVFVMGGDGTVNEGVSGIAEEDYRPHFGFFPLGTVNDLARALDIPLDPKEAIETMLLDQTHPLDIGKVNDHYFTNIVAIGNIPESLIDVEVEDKTKLGPLAYLISAVQNLLSNTSYEFQLAYDGKKERMESSLILIALTNSIGGMNQFTPHAQTNDGYLHLVITQDKNVKESLAALPNLFSKNGKSDEKVSYKKLSKVTIAVKDAELQTNTDGDKGDYLPITVEVLPQHIEVYRCQK